MLFALNSEGTKIAPYSGLKGDCPGCGTPVIAKCGSINIWHWAHESLTECDSWTEPETDWHREWKSKFEPDECEVVIGPHRADVKIKKGYVIEFQHSSISPEEIQERESFYGKMIWIVDVEPFQENFYFGHVSHGGPFTWKWARRSWRAARCPVYIDLRDGYLAKLLQVNWAASPTTGESKNIHTINLLARAGGSLQTPKTRLQTYCEKCNSNCCMKLMAHFEPANGTVNKLWVCRHCRSQVLVPRGPDQEAR